MINSFTLSSETLDASLSPVAMNEQSVNNTCTTPSETSNSQSEIRHTTKFPKRFKTAKPKPSCSKSSSDDVDKELLLAISSLSEQKEEEKECHFASILASTLRRLTPRMRAITKLQMHQLLLEAEFPLEHEGEICKDRIAEEPQKTLEDTLAEDEETVYTLPDDTVLPTSMGKALMEFLKN